MMKRVLSLFLAVALSLSLSACSGEQTPEAAVSKGLDAMKNLDASGIATYYEGVDPVADLSVLETEDAQNMKLFVSKLSYKILSSKEDGDTATVQVDITNLDMEQLFQDYFQEAMGKMLEYAFMPESERPSDEELEKMSSDILIGMMQKDDAPMRTTTVDIQLKKVDGQWKMVSDTTLGNAIFGGLLTALQSMGSMG